MPTEAARPAGAQTGKRSRRGTTAGQTVASKRLATQRLTATQERKRKRAVRVRYVDSGSRTGGTLARRIAVSTVTVDRIVGDRYEWRDGSYRGKRARRGGDQTEVYDDGG